MKNSKENTTSPDAEPAPKGTSTRRTFIGYLLAAGGARLIPGCAATPDKPTAGEAVDEADQLRELGAESVGLQPDGSVVQYGVGESFGKATNKAIRRAEVILGEGDFNFIFSKPLKRSDGKLIVHVRGGEEKPLKIKTLPRMSPETRKKMIEYNQRIIHYLKKELKRYKKNYGDRKEFPKFEAKVQEKIAGIEKGIKGLREGKINKGIIETINMTIDETAYEVADGLINICDIEAELLSVMDRADETRRKAKKKFNK